MDYSSAKPRASELIPYVLSYAQAAGSGGPAEKVIPARTGATLILSLTGTFRVGGHTVGPDEAVILPARDGPLRLEFLVQPVERLIVRFGPCALARFQPDKDFQLPEAELAGLRAALVREQGFERRADLIEAFLLRRFRAPSPEDAALERLAEAITKSRGNLRSLGTLMNRVPLSRRQCERRFLELAGLSPRTFSRICRFEQAKEEVLASLGQKRSLTRIGLDSGYYDQAHFARDFKRSSEFRPGDFAFCPVPKN